MPFFVQQLPVAFLLSFVAATHGNSFSDVRRPKVVGVVERIPGNHTIVVTAGDGVYFACRLKYLTKQIKDIDYWWQKEDEILWHSRTGRNKKLKSIRFTVVDLMKDNNTLGIQIDPVLDDNYGRYKCIFGDRVVQAVTRVCVGAPRWEQLRVLCASNLAKKLNIHSTPATNPTRFWPNETVTMTCKISPSHKEFKGKNTRYQWTIGDDYQMWFDGKNRSIAPPGATFSLDRENQTWSMTVPNASLMFGRMPKCQIDFRRIVFDQPFVIAEYIPPPEPQALTEYMPKSGYFGIFMIMLMIWMLLALNKSNS